MSDHEEGAAAPTPGGSRDGDDSAAGWHDDEGNPVSQLQSQIMELSRKHDAVMSSLANLGDAQSRPVVYIPREKNIPPFSGVPGKDAHTVDEFIDEVERAMRSRGLRNEEQVDFILSQLKGSALEEVKLRMGVQVRQPSDLFLYLRGAFRDKRTAPQLLHAFYDLEQLDGKSLRLFARTLSAA